MLFSPLVFYLTQIHVDTFSVFQAVASIAQWIEHWSRKPGVVSSILTGGSCFARHPDLEIPFRHGTSQGFVELLTGMNMFKACNYKPNIISASIAQWLEHWSCKPGVVSSILTGGSCFSHLTDTVCTRCN